MGQVVLRKDSCGDYVIRGLVGIHSLSVASTATVGNRRDCIVEAFGVDFWYFSVNGSILGDHEPILLRATFADTIVATPRVRGGRRVVCACEEQFFQTKPYKPTKHGDLFMHSLGIVPCLDTIAIHGRSSS